MKAQKEKKIQEEKKVTKRYQGYWAKLAENQKMKKNQTKIRNLAPEIVSTQQADCNPAITNSPMGDDRDTCNILEHSIPSNQLKSENTIALDAQLGQNRGFK